MELQHAQVSAGSDHQFSSKTIQETQWFITRSFAEYIAREEEYDPGPFGALLVESCNEG
jgi:hypothetical protein